MRQSSDGGGGQSSRVGGRQYYSPLTGEWDIRQAIAIKYGYQVRGGLDGYTLKQL